MKDKIDKHSISDHNNISDIWSHADEYRKMAARAKRMSRILPFFVGLSLACLIPMSVCSYSCMPSSIGLIMTLVTVVSACGLIYTIRDTFLIIWKYRELDIVFGGRLEYWLNICRSVKDNEAKAAIIDQSGRDAIEKLQREKETREMAICEMLHEFENTRKDDAKIEL